MNPLIVIRIGGLYLKDVENGTEVLTAGADEAKQFHDRNEAIKFWHDAKLTKYVPSFEEWPPK